MVVKMFCSVKDELHDTSFAQTVVSDGPLDAKCVSSSNDILLLPKSYAASAGYFSAVPACHKIEATSSSRYRKDSNSLSKYSTTRSSTATLRAHSDAFKMSLYDVPVID